MMTDIEQKAMALLNESGWKGAYLKRAWNCRYEALCRAIEQHDAFRREVSDHMSDVVNKSRSGKYYTADALGEDLRRFIIPKPVDPVENVMRLVRAVADDHVIEAAIRELVSSGGGKIGEGA